MHRSTAISSHLNLSRPLPCPCVTDPSQVFSVQLPESICSVDGGYVTSAAAADIIVHTFTGKVGAAGRRRSCYLSGRDAPLKRL